ncbi:hypothetical protein ACXPWS_04985 [Mycobacterium sp. BMJ-28]
MGGHIVLLDVEAVEDGLVEFSAGVVAGFGVELVGVGHQVEACIDERCCSAEVFSDGVEAVGQFHALTVDGVDTCLDLVLWQCALGGDVDEPLLLLLQRAQLSGEVSLGEPLGVLAVFDGGGQCLLHGGDKSRAEGDGFVVLFDGFLDPAAVAVR